MSALSLYNDLIAQGFKLSMNQGKLELVPASRLTDSQRIKIKQHKSELLLLLAANDHLKLATQIEPLSTNFVPTPLGVGEVVNTQIEDRQLPPMEDRQSFPQIEEVEPSQSLGEVQRKKSFNLARYSHCITCNQCEHLSLTGSCTRLGKSVMPDALRECETFNQRQRPLVQTIEANPCTYAKLD